MDAYTERLELPEGQYGLFRTRIGYSGALAIRRAIATERNEVTFSDAVMRAFLVKATLRDFETGELLVNIGPEEVDRGEVETVDKLLVKAMELYIAWNAEAYPKAQAETAPESAEPETSSGSPRPARSRRTTKT